MDEANARVELRITGQPLLDAGHSDQDKSNFITVEQIAKLLQTRNLEPVSFIDKDQPDRRQARLTCRPGDLRRCRHRLITTRGPGCEPVRFEKKFALLSPFLGIAGLSGSVLSAVPGFLPNPAKSIAETRDATARGLFTISGV